MLRRLGKIARFKVPIGALALAALGVWASSALGASAPVPPFTDCPAVAADTSCQYLIDDATGASGPVSVYEDPRTPFYASSGTSGETLVGVRNDTTGPLAKLYVGVDGTADANVDNFAFDGRGLCAPGGPPIPAGCPFAGPAGVDPFDYEGPFVSFDGGGAITDPAAGDVDFSPALAPGATTFFSLHASTTARPLEVGNSAAPTVLVNQMLSTPAAVGNGVTNGQFVSANPVSVNDMATVEGSGAGSASTATFNVYGANAGCLPPALDTQSLPLTSNSATANAFGGSLSPNQIYYWQVEVFDANGRPLAESPCGQATMAFGNIALPASTVTPSLAGGGQSGGAITVPPGTAVTASATASGGGKAYFTFYSDSSCTTQVAAAGGAQVMNGVATAPSAVTLGVGTYYLQVAYTGDPTHASTSSPCGAATLSVATPPTTTSTSTTTTSTTTTISTTTSTSTSTTTPLPPPVLYRTVNVTPVSGKVYVKLPRGAHLSRAPGTHGPLAVDSLAKGRGFIPLTQARQIPVGSELDTTGGTVAITAANTKKGSTYSGDFTAGLFALLQNRKDKGITELNLMNTVNRSRACTSAGKTFRLTHGARATIARTVSSKVLALLKGSDHGGRFSTRGSYSAATTRGTAYSVENECAGTLTKVTRGTVVVDYFRRHKHIVLTAGHEFLAKASGGPSVVVTIGKRAHTAAATAALALRVF